MGFKKWAQREKWRRLREREREMIFGGEIEKKGNFENGEEKRRRSGDGSGD